MRIDRFIEYLKTLPQGMCIYTQTCEGDFCQPLQLEKIWQTEAFVDDRYGLQKPNLVITSFVEGKKYAPPENLQSGFKVMSEDEAVEKQVRQEDEGDRE